MGDKAKEGKEKHSKENRETDIEGKRQIHKPNKQIKSLYPKMNPK